jgi:hypothetical protein
MTDNIIATERKTNDIIVKLRDSFVDIRCIDMTYVNIFDLVEGIVSMTNTIE